MLVKPEPQPMESITTNDVVFTEATPHQRILCWQLNGASWAPPMTIEQYVGRETTLSQTALSANGGTKYWVVHPKDDPETIVSACEVTSKKALVSDQDGTREIPAYSIASVFTNPRFRERGMAGYMLRKVQEEVDRNTECGALYSDIGRIFYTRLGWKDFRSPHVLFTLAQDLAAPSLDGVTLLSEKEILPLCEKDVAAAKEQFRRLEGTNSGKTHVAFLPTAEQLSWHFARDGYVCKTMLGRDVVHRGAKTDDGSAWIYWDHDLREKKLKVLRIVTCQADNPEKQRMDITKLLLAALAEATKLALPKVLAWSPSAEVSMAAAELWHALGPKLQVVFEEREDGSIPSLRWKGGRGLEDVVWEDEYYAWC
ncbi:Lysine acetyltransferase [Madurella mycetomatis]|uniref:Lysine acetyltransferase n=1 Tax=Madurella mycetomatis TaxID=100816 RepID=A0A175W4Q2_9PEZI|nr:Lysine acetyltransferase [Madurella mycetomatis]